MGEIGLSIDGTRLIAMTTSTANPGVIATLDPTTLATTKSVTQLRSIGPEFTALGFGLATTNDGRTWLDLERSNPPFSDLAYATLDTLTATVVQPPGIATDFYLGPWFAGSRDGERLLIVQSSAITPQPPMLYLDAADSVVHVNPAGLTFSYRFSFSEAGDRVVFDAAALRDGSFNLLGQLVIPSTDGYYPLDALISPDGSRIYALSYPSSSSGSNPPSPRIYVFDATVVQANLPILGYFTIADYPACSTLVSSPSCSNYNHASTISIDGQTLYYAGQQSFVVVPTNTPLVVGTAPASILRSNARRAATPWPIRSR